MGQGTLCNTGHQASICLMQGSSLSTVLSLYPLPLSCLSDPHLCPVSLAMGPLVFLSLLPVPVSQLGSDQCRDRDLFLGFGG